MRLLRSRPRPAGAPTTWRELSPAAQRALAERCRTLLDCLDPGGPHTTAGTAADPGDLLAALDPLLADGAPDRIWLSVAVLSARLTDMATVIELSRSVRLDGPGAALRAALSTMDVDELARVEIATGQTVVDVYQTARMPKPTGIQRVARHLARSWAERPGVRLVGWHDEQTALVDLTPAERHHLLTDGAAPPPPPPGHRPTVVVPFRGRYLLPELAVGPSVTPRVQALAVFADCRTGTIGHDCVPLTSSETTHPGTPSHFAGNLAAVRHMDQVAAISESSAAEYRGWRTMVGATGLPGPAITSVLLPTEGQEATPEALEFARRRYLIGDLPMVLVVGTHEPRKNHEAVLHAARVLWREGHRFSLVFVGGPGWRSEPFYASLETLQAEGRPVETVGDVTEDLLWALYRVAHCTLFPSLTEGFGLPVAESLAAGTPVITSGHGSMAEIARDGGALLVDPRSDRQIADALRSLLTDRELHERLVVEADGRTLRTWAQYADEVWAVLTGATDGPDATDGTDAT